MIATLDRIFASLFRRSPAPPGAIGHTVIAHYPDGSAHVQIVGEAHPVAGTERSYFVPADEAAGVLAQIARLREREAAG